MPADTTTYRYKGDFKKCLKLKPIAQQGVFVLHMLMEAGKLNTYQIGRSFPDGSSIRIWSAFGATYAEISVPPIEEEKEKKKEVKPEDNESLVLVYIGPPSNVFSEYTFNDLVERTTILWKTVPEFTLEKLMKKRLLVLPCPVRSLTADEKSIINKFRQIKGNRVAVFCGDDIVSANSVLADLNSMLEFIVDEAGSVLTFDLSGYLPTSANSKMLFYLWSEAPASIGVRQAYWSTAVVKDPKGYGIAYNNITNMSPKIYFYPTGVEGPYDLNFRMTGAPIGPADDYLYTTGMDSYESDLEEVFNEGIDPGDSNWKNFYWSFSAWNFSDAYYSSAYITWNYNDLDETDMIAWAAANAQLMPWQYVFRHGFIPAQTTYGYATYWDFADCATKVNVLSGSSMAFADDESIIVASFKSTFLVTAATPGATTNQILKCYPLEDFANWLLFYDMTPYHDMFNTKGLFTLTMPYHYSMNVGYTTSGGGYGGGIQY